MRWQLLTVAIPPNEWSSLAVDELTNKLNHFVPFSVTGIKTGSWPRSKADQKKLSETRGFLGKMKGAGRLILIDQRGRTFRDSRAFALAVEQLYELRQDQVTFLVGGAFGVSEEVRAHASDVWSLGPLTFSHPVAQVVFLEQLYRAWTIIKNIPYHNG